MSRRTRLIVSFLILLLLCSCSSDFWNLGDEHKLSCSAKSGKYPNGLKCVLYQEGYDWEDPTVIFYGHNAGLWNWVIDVECDTTKDTVGWQGNCTDISDPYYWCIPIVNTTITETKRETLGIVYNDATRPTLMFHEESDTFLFQPGSYWIITAQAQFMPGMMPATDVETWTFDCR